MMVNLHLAPFPRPVSSLVDDFPTEQGHKGWEVSACATYELKHLANVVKVLWFGLQLLPGNHSEFLGV